MSEVAKLRALLVEARGFVRHRGALHTEDCATCDLFDRIGDALSQPVSPVWGENARLDTMWQELVRERDEARAEIADAIEAARIRGANVLDDDGQPKTLLILVSGLMHDLLGAKAGLRDMTEVYERLKAERDEARVTVERLREVLRELYEQTSKIPTHPRHACSCSLHQACRKAKAAIGGDYA